MGIFVSNYPIKEISVTYSQVYLPTVLQSLPIPLLLGLPQYPKLGLPTPVLLPQQRTIVYSRSTYSVLQGVPTPVLQGLPTLVLQGLLTLDSQGLTSPVLLGLTTPELQGLHIQYFQVYKPVRHNWKKGSGLSDLNQLVRNMSYQISSNSIPGFTYPSSPKSTYLSTPIHLCKMAGT